MLKKSKKGFTLAELLIVVAIIAVLTAIAVPLFVGALNNAEQNVKDSDVRAVRAAGVVYILQHQDDVNLYESKDKTKGLKGPWVATAYVTADGAVEQLSVAIKGELDKDSCDTSTETGKKAYKYKVTAVIYDLNDATASRPDPAAAA